PRIHARKKAARPVITALLIAHAILGFTTVFAATHHAAHAALSALSRPQARALQRFGWIAPASIIGPAQTGLAIYTVYRIHVRARIPPARTVATARSHLRSGRPRGSLRANREPGADALLRRPHRRLRRGPHRLQVSPAQDTAPYRHRGRDVARSARRPLLPFAPARHDVRNLRCASSPPPRSC